jgi:2-keto-4-pentenoate hydratase
MNSSPEIEAAAIRLRVAEETGKPCAPVRELFADPNLAAAYAIQAFNREHWLRRG